VGAEDYLRFADHSHSIRQNHVKGSFLLEICTVKLDLQLLADRSLASQFVGEVLEEVTWFWAARVSACGSMTLLARQAIVQHRALPGE
jgi:hypothetical protein